MYVHNTHHYLVVIALHRSIQRTATRDIAHRHTIRDATESGRSLSAIRDCSLRDYLNLAIDDVRRHRDGGCCRSSRASIRFNR